MEKTNRLSLRLQIRSFKNTFFQTSELPFKELLPDHLIRKIQRSGSRRETIFTPLITLRAFLFQVLSANGSCTEAVTHVLIERIGSGHSRNSLNTGSYCKARSRLSLAHLKRSRHRIGSKIASTIGHTVVMAWLSGVNGGWYNDADA